MTEIFEKKIYSDSMTSYLIIIPEKDIVDTISMNMMKNNIIDGFLNMECRYVDNKMLLYYNIKGMQSLSEYIAEKTLDYKFIRGLYNDIIKAVCTGEAYFLNENTYMLLPEYIYCDRKSAKIRLCCVPGWSGSFCQSVKELTQELIEHVDHKDKAALEFIYGIYDLVTESGFAISEVSQYIERFKSGNLQNDNKIGISQCNKEQHDEKQLENNSKNTDREYDAKSDKQERKIYGLSVISGNSGSKDKNTRTEVIWLENEQEDILATQTEIKIGRMEEENNIVIPYNYISRNHALIIIEDSNFCIVDNGSSNGTYINNKKISANEKIQCYKDDIISFADISYKVIFDLKYH